MDVVGQMPLAVRTRALSMDGIAMQQQNTQAALRSPVSSGLPPMMSGSSAAAYALARSPPKAKNTSHVPCKFYPYGTCQAGNACQFSHDLGAISQVTPCKYFAKGSCKFGQSCALAHILSDGRMVNKAPPPPRLAPQRGRVGQLSASLQQSPTSPYLSSTQSGDLYGLPQHQESSSAYSGQVTSPSVRVSHHNNELYSPFGSPHAGQFPISPSRGQLTALDVPLPGSFDSQGISQAARHGPFAASVPPRFGFGFESPPSSLSIKNYGSNLPLRDTREPSYGDTNNLDGVLHGLGTSPQSYEPMSFKKRSLHSERLAVQRPLLSSSLDTRPSRLVLEQTMPDDEDDDGVGEELLPSSLHDLLPQEKLRRPSRSAVDETLNTSFATSPRRGFSTSNNTPVERPGNLSPIASSPSRYSSMWAARSSGGRETEPAASTFGHVGSPLRPSALRTSSPLAPLAPMATFTSRASAKPSQSKLSILTKELQRSRLSANDTSVQSPLSLLATENMNRDEQNARAEQSAIEAALTGTTNGEASKNKPEEEPLFSMEDEDERGRALDSKTDRH